MNILLSICTILTTKLLAYASLSGLAQTCGDRSNPDKGECCVSKFIGWGGFVQAPRRAYGERR